MKTIHSIRLILSLFAIVVFMLVLKSCKKTDFSPPNNIKTAEDTKVKVRQAIKAKYGNVSAGFVYNVNKTANEYFYKNTAGNMVSLYGNNNFGGGNTTSLCTYNCNNTNNPGDLFITYTLNYIQRFYECESNDKSKISVNWIINVPFLPDYFVMDYLPNTFGTVKFSPSGGSPVTLTANAGSSDFTIVDLGAYPGCTYNTLYQITYSFDNVPNSYMLSGTTIEANISIDNDCTLLGNVVASGLVAAPAITDELNLPCERIDKAYVVPNSGPSNCATVAGNYILCSPPSGLTPIDNHQVEYREVTHGSSLAWDDQSNPVYWGEPTGTNTPITTVDPYTGVSDLVNMTPSSGLWLVRYRNVKTSVCNPIYNVGNTPNGPWGNTALWIVEVWSL